MSSTETSKALTSAAASLQPLTTPFAPPASCGGIFDLTTTVTPDQGSGAAFEARISLPEHDPSCQPSGWHFDADQPRQLSFSPAVCPSSWTAYGMRLGPERYTTQAVCCSPYAEQRQIPICFAITNIICCSGFKYTWAPMLPPVGVIIGACIQTINSDDVDADSSTPVPPTDAAGAAQYKYGVRAHFPWSISWANSDLTALSPSPPSLTSDCSEI